MRLALALSLLLLAGCNSPSTSPPGLAPVETPPALAPAYEVAIVVTQETPSGAPLPAEVQGVALLSDGRLGPMQVRGTDTTGAARFSFREPTTLLIRVLGPEGWTREGARVHIASAVAAEGLTVSDRDVFLPLYRSTLSFSFDHTWSTASGEFQPDGSVTPAIAVQSLTFPDGLQVAYLARLASAKVATTWVDSPDGRAVTVAAGLAWAGNVWVAGNESTAASTGARTAMWDGDLPANGRPSDLAATTLQSALLTETAVVGDVLFGIDVHLDFGGFVPKEIPADDCHLRLTAAAMSPC